MHKISRLNNGLTLITVDRPFVDSVTVIVVVGAGSRYEDKKTSGISHFLEHMFFKGSRKYPTAEQIATLVDGIGAVNNAATDYEVVYYWIKSADNHIDLSTDILSSMLKEPLFAEEEVAREKDVIIEEMKMYRDNPMALAWNSYMSLQFGDSPLGWDIIGNEETIKNLTRQDLVDYSHELYSPKNMALVYVGKLPENIKQIAEKYFLDLPKRSSRLHALHPKIIQSKPRVELISKAIDQTHLILGVEGYGREDKRRYAARLLAKILGEGMSSRLFIQIREKRGLAYHVSCEQISFKDTGLLAVYGGLKTENAVEALEVIKLELENIKNVKVTEQELKKAKEMEKGRLALKSESTNFLAEYFGINFVLKGEIETFDEYLARINAVTAEDIQKVAKDLFKNKNYNLQIVGPVKAIATAKEPFEKVLAV